MKRAIFLVIVLGFFGTAVHSQNNSIGQSDPDAKKILDQVSKKIKGYKSIQANFSLKIEDANSVSQGLKKGTVYMKGNKYKIVLTGQEIYCDGTTVWTYDKSSNEVTITKFDPSGNSQTPQKIFTDFYDKDFLYKLNGEKKVGDKMLQEIEMTPVDKTKNFHKIYVYVDKAKQSVYSSKMLDKNGTRYIYTITSLVGNAPLPDDIFVFDKSKYPGVEEVDLRQ